MTNRASRDKPDAGGADKPVGPGDGISGRRHPRIDAEEIDGAESDASPADQLHAADGVRGTTRRSKQGQYRAKTLTEASSRTGRHQRESELQNTERRT